MTSIEKLPLLLNHTTYALVLTTTYVRTPPLLLWKTMILEGEYFTIFTL